MNPITAVAELGNTLIDKFFPDAGEKDKRQMELLLSIKPGLKPLASPCPPVGETVLVAVRIRGPGIKPFFMPSRRPIIISRAPPKSRTVV